MSHHVQRAITLGARRGAPRRIATLSVHTSPLHQPGTGDAGGMNVYIVELSKRLAALGIEVEIFTRATGSDLPPVVEMAPGVLVRHVTAGPYEGLSKEDLPAQLCAFTSGVLRTEAMRDPGHYDLVHSHYWLSGQVGWLAKERWGVPLVHTMHTMAKVKNASLAGGDAPEPRARVIGESQVVEAADRLVANTVEEADQLIDLYDAEPDQVAVVNPGVDLETFRPGDMAAARRRLDVPEDATVILFAGRIQPLKAPDVLLYAIAHLLQADPALRDSLVVAVVGGPSGNGMAAPEHLHKLAATLGIHDVVRFQRPVRQDVLADWYRAATVAVVPSYNESFGLVAIEAQACGTPVVAAAVGGLPTAVRDGVSGTLVRGHNPVDYGLALRDLIRAPRLREDYAEGAVRHAAAFGWAAAAGSMAEVYADTLARSAAPRGQVVGGQ
ncbi:D-inositol-3-phosphate glycosyltransferase [Embleya hyalina]|uniref:D-inositol-3-phosphate glycosyltransferase n=1 Tax=Embleya hyalina TaxID=516124 RepID=A0A401YI20_9ACTN|nr:D-inositol-3-phosphate glycosyltransferase [Embleya hyalina]GCD94245.1 D-inositol 3-phosphate glycosyltransferase [Embleya hyalina]